MPKVRKAKSETLWMARLPDVGVAPWMWSSARSGVIDQIDRESQASPWSRAKAIRVRITEIIPKPAKKGKKNAKA
jgi:hypothetical protein